MIKAAATTDKGRLFVLGLSFINLDLLRSGRPIRVDLAELGGEGEVIIFAGQTEGTMQADLADLIGPETKMKGPTQ